MSTHQAEQSSRADYHYYIGEILLLISNPRLGSDFWLEVMNTTYWLLKVNRSPLPLINWKTPE